MSSWDVNRGRGKIELKSFISRVVAVSHNQHFSQASSQKKHGNLLHNILHENRTTLPWTYLSYHTGNWANRSKQTLQKVHSQLPNPLWLYFIFKDFHLLRKGPLLASWQQSYFIFCLLAQRTEGGQRGVGTRWIVKPAVFHCNKRGPL